MNNQVAGLDLHKDQTYITVMGKDGQVLGEKVLKSKAGPILNYLRNFDKPEVVFEATRNWYWLYDALQREDVEITMAHPKKTKAIGAARIKTDRIDSHTLAHLKRADLIPESYLAPLETRELRELLRHRIFLVRERAKVKSKIRTLLSKLNLICPKSDVLGKEAIIWLRENQKKMPEVFSDKLDDFLAVGGKLTEVIERTNAVIKREAEEDEIVRLLKTIPGIGRFSAMLIKAEIGTISRFPDADHLASYCGLVPSTHSSGNYTHRGSITKEGNPWLRWVLTEATGKLKGKSKHFEDFYYRVLAKKTKKVARVATARKLAVALYYIWKRREPFKEPKING
ncbi:MAG: IS110 family transposase [Candidatus Bipolaricaulia bacterium]